MVVHRQVPEVSSDPQTRSQLGHLLVTIDDLAALFSLFETLQRDVARSSAHPHQIKVEFEGGTFTEPEDLRTLSDEEITSLRISGTGIGTVTLNPNQASVTAKKSAAEAIYRQWARTRTRKVKGRKSIRQLAAFSGCLMIGFGLNLGVYLTTVDISASTATRIVLITTAIILFFLGLASVILSLRYAQRGSGPVSSALIIPKTLDQYRQSAENNVYPRKAYIVAIVSAVIAVAAVIVAILALK